MKRGKTKRYSINYKTVFGIKKRKRVKKVKEERKMEGKDICYGCGKIFPHNTLYDINDVDFDIYCKTCKPELYKIKKKKRVKRIKFNFDLLKEARKMKNVKIRAFGKTK